MHGKEEETDNGREKEDRTDRCRQRSIYKRPDRRFYPVRVWKMGDRTL